jgi:HAD superfamily hydrolase (TIGR01509 family)
VRIPVEVDAVIFDCDGLLAETESGWTRAETAIFREHGYDFGPEQKQLLIGGTLASAGEKMAAHFGLPGTGPVLAARLARLVSQEVATGVPAMPGARQIAETLRYRGIPIAVASNSSRDFVDAVLASAGLLDLFEVIVSSDDVENGKPAPDLYLTACAWLSAEPERSVAFEDSRTGVASALAAKMFVIGVPSVPGTTIRWRMMTSGPGWPTARRGCARADRLGHAAFSLRARNSRRSLTVRVISPKPIVCSRVRNAAGSTGL